MGDGKVCVGSPHIRRHPLVRADRHRGRHRCSGTTADVSLCRWFCSERLTELCLPTFDVPTNWRMRWRPLATKRFFGRDSLDATTTNLLGQEGQNISGILSVASTWETDSWLWSTIRSTGVASPAITESTFCSISLSSNSAG